jgi:hypothetical protein
MSEPITLEALLAGELDPESVGLNDIATFCADMNLDYEVSSEKEKRDMLNDIADLLAPPQEESEKPADVPVTVESYASANGVSIDEVKKATGLTRKNQKLTDEMIDRLPELLAQKLVNETETASSAPIPEEPKKKSDFLSRRADKIAQAKARTGTSNGSGASGVNFPIEKYENLTEEQYKALPDRIKRNLERQKKQRG